jgi:hypothetical protein
MEEKKEKICPVIGRKCIEEKCAGYIVQGPEMKYLAWPDTTVRFYDKKTEIRYKPFLAFDHYEGFWPFRREVLKEVTRAPSVTYHIVKEVDFFHPYCQLLTKKSFK